jgi:hypothetical protein
MKPRRLWTGMVTAVLLAVSSVAASQMHNMPPGMALINPVVRKEVGLSADQQARIDRIFEPKMVSHGNTKGLRVRAGEDLNPLNRDILAVLKPEQRTRVRQLWIQMNDGFCLQDDDLRKELGMSDSQRIEVIKLIAEFEEAVQDHVRSAARSEGAVSMATPKSLIDGYKNKLVNVMTKEQKPKYQSLKGKIVDIFPNRK